jgi:hypothetical protein
MTPFTDDLDLVSATAGPVQRWFPQFVRAIKACRFYPSGSVARERHVTAGHALLAEVLRGQPEIRFDVKQGRLYFGSERVHTDPEKDGLARALFAASIFQLSLLDGISRDEFEALAEALSIDFLAREHAGDDLVTWLWRLDLTHVRYEYFDIFNVAVRLDEGRSDVLAASPNDDETGRLRREMAEIVSKMSIDRRTGADLIAMDSRSLATPDEIRDEAHSADNTFEIALAMYQKSVPEEAVRSIPKALAAGNAHREIAAHLLGLLFDALRSEERPSDPSPALEFLLRLFDGMIEVGEYEDATKLILRLQDIAQRSKNPTEASFVQRLLARFSSEHEIARVITALNAADRSTGLMKIVGYLRALDHYAVRAVLALVDLVSDPLAREMIADLLIEMTAIDRSALVARLTSMRWEMAADLVVRSRAIHPDERLELLIRILEHPHPKPRIEALRELRTSPRGPADEAIARMLRDRDGPVRLAALKIAAARRTLEVLRELSHAFVRADLGEHDPRELKQMMITYGTIAGERAISDLSRFLGQSGGFMKRKRSASIKAAAAHGLKAIGSDAARAILEKGARSLNLGVRAACKRALESDEAHLLRVPVEAPPIPPPPPPLKIPTTPTSSTQTPTIARTIGRGMHLLAAPDRTTNASAPKPRPMPPPAGHEEES